MEKGAGPHTPDSLARSLLQASAKTACGTPGPIVELLLCAMEASGVDIVTRGLDKAARASPRMVPALRVFAQKVLWHKIMCTTATDDKSTNQALKGIYIEWVRLGLLPRSGSYFGIADAMDHATAALEAAQKRQVALEPAVLAADYEHLDEEDRRCAGCGEVIAVQFDDVVNTWVLRDALVRRSAGHATGLAGEVLFHRVCLPLVSHRVTRS